LRSSIRIVALRVGALPYTARGSNPTSGEVWQSLEMSGS
jgi:hypothetical protein